MSDEHRQMGNEKGHVHDASNVVVAQRVTDPRLRSPDAPINCLLVHPRFSAFSFWNYRDTAATIGAKSPSPPLGLITIAAILPTSWNFRLKDLNARPLTEADWEWADVICTGGMLPQQTGILDIIKQARSRGKFVAVGGPDPSSQPQLYTDANALVLGEGESSIPIWMDSWRAGSPEGRFETPEKPDVTKSPVPRFDLLKFEDYVQIGIQYSRGCPFNCEFCDIIELYGRKPRTKEPRQIIAELEELYRLGYSGSVDLVDDNFIGNKRAVKRDLLPALIEWNRCRGYPFFYSTEASMNMSDDIKLMELMQEAEFRNVFMGIETPDPDLLMGAQKTQNTMRPIVDRVNIVYGFGLVVAAGFIMGFDNEKPGIDDAMVRLIEESGINMAMIGLLVALPNTQLTRRLLKEGRLLSFQGKLITSESEMFAASSAHNAPVEIVDQTLAGLNFITTRDRLRIFREYRSVVQRVYAPKAYFNRALRTIRKLKVRSKHIPRWFEIKRSIRGMVMVSLGMTFNRDTCWYYWRNFFFAMVRGPHVVEQAVRIMAIYLHFQRQSRYLVKAIESQEPAQRKVPADLSVLTAS